MQIQFGLDAAQAKQNKKVPVCWDSQRLINGHAMIAGKSGTGKTHILRKMLGQLQAQAGGRLRVHIFDAHGDIDIAGASTVKFSESTAYGFNPLQINPDPDDSTLAPYSKLMAVRMPDSSIQQIRVAGLCFQNAFS